MSNEIQVGEYVRTKLGIIDKIDKENKIGTYLKDIVKHSPNIIDLIEVGDFVNGIEVEEFDDDEGHLYLGFGIFTDSCMDCIEEIRPLSTVDIKTIVTKEQFKSMEYKVGGENESI